jgi:hypothetical protein
MLAYDVPEQRHQTLLRKEFERLEQVKNQIDNSKTDKLIEND